MEAETEIPKQTDTQTGIQLYIQTKTDKLRSIRQIDMGEGVEKWRDRYQRNAVKFNNSGP